MKEPRKYNYRLQFRCPDCGLTREATFLKKPVEFPRLTCVECKRDGFADVVLHIVNAEVLS